MTGCIVDFQLGEYLDQLDADHEAEAAREQEFESAMSEVPEPVLEVIRHWLGKDPEFCAEIEAALDNLITMRNEP